MGLRRTRPGSAPTLRAQLRRGRLAATVFAIGALLFGPASTFAADPVRFDVLVAKVSTTGQPEKIDPKGKALHTALAAQIRYDRLEVLATETFVLGIDEVGRAALPNGRELLVKPLVVDAAGALVAVDVRGLLKTDLRMKSDHLVVIGAESYEGGKLVVSLEPHFSTP